MKISYSSESYHSVTSYGASQVALVVKNVCANVREDVRDTGSISGSGRSPSAGALCKKREALELPSAKLRVPEER